MGTMKQTAALLFFELEKVGNQSNEQQLETIRTKGNRLKWAL
jgi:hypothetical protein